MSEKANILAKQTLDHWSNRNLARLIINRLDVCICLAKIQTYQSDKQIFIVCPIDYLLFVCLQAISIPPR